MFRKNLQLSRKTVLAESLLNKVTAFKSFMTEVPIIVPKVGISELMSLQITTSSCRRHYLAFCFYPHTIVPLFKLLPPPGMTFALSMLLYTFSQPWIVQMIQFQEWSIENWYFFFDDLQHRNKMTMTITIIPTKVTI